MAGSVDVRPYDASEWDAWWWIGDHAFNETGSPERRDQEASVFEPERGLSAYVDGELAGTAAAYTLGLTVPGGATPDVAAVTAVSVLSTMRRRGVMSTLIQRQLDDLHTSDGEPVAALWASEPGIYGRFGYGVAAYATRFDHVRDPHALDVVPRDESVRLRMVRPDESLDAAMAVYEANRDRPGMLSRTRPWAERATWDSPADRDGASALRCVLAEGENGPRGYAYYSTAMEWRRGPTTGVLGVREMFATDPGAYLEVWRHLLSVDLVTELSAWNRPVDDPLRSSLVPSRRPMWAIRDGLWVRLVDVGRALAGRGYSSDVDVVIDVTDARCPWNEGRWRLSADRSGATCDRTRTAPDLTVDVAGLGAAYLGGVSLRVLEQAGRVGAATPGAVGVLAAAMNHDPQPWCPVVF